MQISERYERFLQTAHAKHLPSQSTHHAARLEISIFVTYPEVNIESKLVPASHPVMLTCTG